MRAKLRAEGSNGGTKDWTIMAFADHCEIRFGTTGTKLRSQIVPVEKCQSNSPFLEARKRLEIKKKEGYWVIDDSQANINNDGIIQLLTVKRGKLSDDEFNNIMKNAVSIVETAFTDSNDVIENDSMSPVTSLSAHGQLVVVPSDNINDAIFIMSILQIESKAIFVRDMKNKTYSALELYDGLEMCNNICANSIAIKTGLIAAPEIFKADAQFNAWFF
jgi:hypothetical protein